LATLRRYTSDILSILSRFKYNRDSRISELFVANLIGDYRSKEIRDSASRNNNETDFSSWQTLGVVKATQVSSVDDPTLMGSCKNMGKITVPTPIYLPGNCGVQLFTPSGEGQYHEVSMSQFMAMPKDYLHSPFRYFYRVGNSVYFSYDKYVKPFILLDNPMDGYVFNTGDIASGDLIYNTDYTVAESYVVESGTIVHDGTTYSAGNVFVATRPDYTGTGVVKLSSQKRRFGWDDEYPMSSVMWEVIKAKIFSIDFRFEATSPSDDNNNSQDEAKAN
jgi:hypothetical protein